MTASTPEISVVIPVFNEEDGLTELVSRVKKVLADPGITSEIIFVNDGSTDGSLSLLKRIAADSRQDIKIIDFSRNFGHQIAITAGIDQARGDAVIVMDADLQDPPEVLLRMIEKWREGFDVVYAVREHRSGETFFKKFTAGAFYRLLRSLTKIDIPVDTGDFRLMSRPVVQALGRMPEKNRFVRGMVSWVGFEQTGVYYERQERFAGETKYPLRKMLIFAWDGITSFSNFPLKLATYFGFLISLIGFLFAIVVVLQFLQGVTVRGWASLMTTILVIGGIQMMIIGIIGEYLGRVFEESKNRPLYVVRELVGFHEISTTTEELYETITAAEKTHESTSPKL